MRNKRLNLCRMPEKWLGHHQRLVNIATCYFKYNKLHLRWDGSQDTPIIHSFEELLSSCLLGEVPSSEDVSGGSLSSGGLHSGGVRPKQNEKQSGRSVMNGELSYRMGENRYALILGCEIQSFKTWEEGQSQWRE